MKKMAWGEDPELSGPRNWFRESLIIKEVHTYKPHGKILDFGCGSGTLLARLGKNGYYGTGMDISASAIKYSKYLFRKIGLEKNLKARIGKEKDLLLKRNKSKYDIVVSGETLEHLKDDQKAVNGFFHTLKKGGICVVSVPAHMYLWDINDDFSSHFIRYEKDNLSKLFTNAGFTIKKGYYWGFPLSLWWHRNIYLKMVEKKMKENTVYTKSKSIVGVLLSQPLLKELFSLPFWFDQIFNFTKKGGGLILVAEKV